MTILRNIFTTPARAVLAGALALSVPAALALPAAPAMAQADRLSTLTDERN